MPLSPLCLVADGAGPFVPTTGGVNVVANDTIQIKLNDTSVASSWYLTILGTDELTTPPALTNVNPGTGQVVSPTSVVSFTYPNAAGRAIVFQSTVFSGPSSLTTTFAIYTLTGGGTRVGAAGETREGNQTYGWITILNPIMRQGASYIYYNDLTLPATGSNNVQGALDHMKTLLSIGSIRWKPGVPTSGNTVSTWVEVMGRLASNPGGFDCFVDTSVAAAIIPLGTYDTLGVLKLKPYREGTTGGMSSHAAAVVQFAAGALVKNLASLDDGVILERLGTNVILSWDAVAPGGVIPIFRLTNGSGLIDVGSGPGPMISVPDGTTLALLLTGFSTQLIAGGGPIVNVGVGSLLFLSARNGATLSTGWATSTDGSGTLLYVFDGETGVPTTAGFTGSIQHTEAGGLAWTTAGRPTNSRDGLMGYNSTLSAVEFWFSGSWHTVFTAGGDLTGSSTSQTVAKINGGTAPSTPLIGDVGKVIVVTGAATYGLTASSSIFTAGGDLSGTATSQNVIKLQGKAVSSTAPTDGQFLMWSTTDNQYEPTTKGPSRFGAAMTQSTTLTGPQGYVIFPFDPSLFPAPADRTITFEVVGQVANGTDTLTVILTDVTDAVVISTLTTSSTTPVDLTQALTIGSAGTNVIPNAKKLYQITFQRTGGSPGDAVTIHCGHFEVKY